MVVRFGGRNPRAESWLRQHSSDLITEITNDQRTGIRAALDARMQRGDHPRSVALDIIGRTNKATRKREGGLIGLTSGQIEYVISARAELSDPTLMVNYLRRGRRDKRYDRLVIKAMRDGMPLSRADIQRVTGRYADRLLVLRGETIARTEAIASTHAAQLEAMRQLVDTGKVQASQVRKIWKATGDGRTRDSHLVLHGESVGLEEMFTSPATGALMEHPGDKGHDARGQDTINCRCWMETRVDYLGNL